MGAGYEVVAHEGILGAADLGHDRLDGVTSAVVVAVAGGAGEMALADSVMDERRQNFAAVVFCDFLCAGECFGAHFFRIFGKGFDTGIDVEKLLFHWNSSVLDNKTENRSFR